MIPGEPCAKCGRTFAGLGYYLCAACTISLRERLELIPDLLTELEVTTSRQARLSRGGGKRSDVSPLPNLRTADLALSVATSVTGWARVLLEEALELEAPAGGAVEAARWLAQPASLEELARREWSGEAATELEELCAASWRAIDRPAARWYAGPCPGPQGGACGSTLWATITDATVRCRQCSSRHDVLDRRRWLLAAAQDVIGPADEIASVLSRMTAKRLSPATIRSWRHRGLLEPVGAARPNGLRMYRLGDVLDVLDRPRIPRQRLTSARDEG